MDTLASFYPALDERQQIPLLYLPITYSLTLLPFLTNHPRRAAVGILPLLIALCVLSPRYTFGDPPSDYYQSSAFIAFPIWYLEFAILRSVDGSDAPQYIGNPHESTGSSPRRHSNCQTTKEKLFWTLKLMVPSHRGVGWNWQAKAIPEDPYQHLPRWKYVTTHLGVALYAHFESTAMLIALGLASTLHNRDHSHAPTTHLLNAAVGWSGALWICDRLRCFYSLLAATSVAVGLCETWQWPPLMGHMSDAWSVGRVWSVAYHQTMRQLISQPARRIARALGFPRGSIALRTTQLFGSFAVSCIVHQFQMFNVTRRDMGEFAFFMSQPFAISVEEVVRWVWQRRPRQLARGTSIRLETLVGYSWVMIWFSVSLPVYVKGCRDAGIIRDVVLGNRPFDFGASFASSVFAA